jgi:membrane-associated phospholipid phosphatase
MAPAGAAAVWSLGMRYLTNLGDAAVVLPVAALILLWLLDLAGQRIALLWCCALLVAGGGTALLKIYIDACTIPVAGLDSPSGHTGMSTLVYGGLALMIGAETASWRRLAVGAAGVVLVAAIALSRVVLGAHDVIEVVVGLLIGGTALALFARGYVGVPIEGARRIWPLVIATSILAVALALSDHPTQLEPFWHLIADDLRNATGLCRA